MNSDQTVECSDQIIGAQLTDDETDQETEQQIQTNQIV